VSKYQYFVNLKQSGLLTAARERVEIINENTFQTSPPYEILVGNLAGNTADELTLNTVLYFPYSKNPNKHFYHGS